MVSFKRCRDMLNKLETGKYMLQYSTVEGVTEWGVVESINNYDVNVQSVHHEYNSTDAHNMKSNSYYPTSHFCIDLSNKTNVQHFKIKVIPLEEFKIISIK